MPHVSLLHDRTERRVVDFGECPARRPGSDELGPSLGVRAEVLRFAMTPVDWMPCTSATPSTLARKDLRRRFRNRGRREVREGGQLRSLHHRDPLVRASWPIASPTSRTSEGLKLAASPNSAGNAVTPVSHSRDPWSVGVRAAEYTVTAHQRSVLQWRYVERTTKETRSASVIRRSTSFANATSLIPRCRDCATTDTRWKSKAIRRRAVLVIGRSGHVGAD